MILKKLPVLVLLVILFGGCSTSFKSNWANFNAYYNTFYNARKSFNAGVEKNLGQTREYNPLQPIRIHQSPVNAGAQDFEKAIEKAADILRKHDDTKWVDDALFLIGKSYYYKQEYFSAEQKFEELYVTTNNPDLKQQAIFWRGRVLLEMNRHGEAIAYLNEQIDEHNGAWDRKNLAETKAILAQHFASQENWAPAAAELETALQNLPLKEYRERGYFLLGQLYEELGKTDEAFEAYRKVQSHFHEYRVQYLAKRKQAEVARNLGRHDVASALFNEMVRDDKNIDYKSELDFELARTEQRRGNVNSAESLYKNLLRNQFSRPTPEITARTYYGLAEIYRYDYNNFQLAAAYYDSAAQRNVPAERLPESFDAAALAQSFGSYAQLKTEIAFQDSMLWLASLNPMEFDSVITQIRAQKIAEIQQMRADEEARQNTMVTIDQQDSEDVDASNLRNGFLNSDNLVLQQNAKMQFLAVWGDRPLADNWRVRSLIRVSASDDENGSQINQTTANERTAINVTIDISQIPFTEVQQDSVRKQISSYQYQLGNLFFLSMNMPDSAVYYFEKAVENPSNDNVTIVSLYSLSELFAMQNNDQKALHYANVLIQNFPETEYAQRLAESFEIELEQSNTSKIEPLEVYQSINENDSLSGISKAEHFKLFAEDFAPNKLAAQAQWQAVQIYMNLGKANPDYKLSIENWTIAHQNWALHQEEFKVQQDSARALLQDTTLTQELQEQYELLIDSTLSQPDFSNHFPYFGDNWDSARTAIDTYLENFTDAQHQSRVQILKDEIAPPAKVESEEISEANPTTEREHSDYKSCTELEERPEIRGGMQNFLAELELPQDFNSEITYQFLINQRGIIDEFSLLTDSIPREIIEIFEEAFQDLSFEPILVNGETVSVQCDFSFPVE